MRKNQWLIVSHLSGMMSEQSDRRREMASSVTREDEKSLRRATDAIYNFAMAESHEDLMSDIRDVLYKIVDAMFEDDPDGDSVIRLKIYDPAVSGVIKIRDFHPEIREQKLSYDPNYMSEVTQAIIACDQVLSGAAENSNESVFDKISNFNSYEQIIDRLFARVKEKGRNHSNGGWPDVSPEDLSFLTTLMSDFTTAATSGSLNILVIDKKQGEYPLSFPHKKYGEKKCGGRRKRTQHLGRCGPRGFKGFQDHPSRDRQRSTSKEGRRAV